MRAVGGVKLLILDDWGLEPLTAEQRHDLLEIVEDRYGPDRVVTGAIDDAQFYHRGFRQLQRPPLAPPSLRLGQALGR